jgi:hypothetical protein
MPGLPAQDLNTSSGIAGRVNGGGAGAANVPGLGCAVGDSVGAVSGVALHDVMTQSAVPRVRPVHTLQRTSATLSCPPMLTTRVPDRPLVP